MCSRLLKPEAAAFANADRAVKTTAWLRDSSLADSFSIVLDCHRDLLSTAAFELVPELGFIAMPIAAADGGRDDKACADDVSILCAAVRYLRRV